MRNGFVLTHAVGSPTTLHGEFMGGGPQLELTAAHGNVILEPQPKRITGNQKIKRSDH